MGNTPPSDPNLCDACSRIVDNIQDSTLIESAIPYELDDNSSTATPDQNASPELEAPKTTPTDRERKPQGG